MSKQFLFSAAAVIAALSLFFLGRTTEKKSGPGSASTVSSVKTTRFDIESYLLSEKKLLSIGNQKRADSIAQVSSPSDFTQKTLKMNLLADFWRDSGRNPLIYSYYVSEASKLDNSVKSLNFAAQLSLGLMRSETDAAKSEWLASNALDLFDRALKLDPSNDELKIGLGSVYIFRQGKDGNPESTMKGIMQILEVARRDSNNLKAQLMLGIGGFVSGQYDKAETRLLRVVEKEPGNLEAVAFLADTYAALGKNKEAVKYYEISKRLANDPQYSREADERIRILQGKQ